MDDINGISTNDIAEENIQANFEVIFREKKIFYIILLEISVTFYIFRKCLTLKHKSHSIKYRFELLKVLQL